MLMVGLLVHVLLGCEQEVLAPLAPSIQDSGSSDGGGSDSGEADGCQPVDLGLSTAFERADQPTVGVVSAQVPAGDHPDAARVIYSDEDFEYRVELDLERVVDGDRLSWWHPFPSGAQVALRLELDEGGARVCQTQSVSVPQLDPEVLPALVSTWTYEAFPRPVAVAAPITTLEPDGILRHAVVIFDQRGRYLWRYDRQGDRALPSPDGLVLLSPSSLDAAALLQIGWDGQEESLGFEVSGYHHDYDYDQGVLYALSDERIPALEKSCALPLVYGDTIERLTSAGTELLWATSTDYPLDYPACDQITDQSISYLNGLNFNDGILSVSSAPGASPMGLLIGWDDGGWQSRLLSDRPEYSDLPIRYEGSCAEAEGDVAPQAINTPHGSACEATRWEAGAGELSCFVHNRRDIFACDSVEWLKITIGGQSDEARCVASTFPQGAAMGDEICGDWSSRGNVELLDGRLSEPDGVFGIQFSPGNTFVTGLRIHDDGAPAIERAFTIRDPNTDISARGRAERGCLNPSKVCTVDGTFASVALGLAESWSPIGAP